MIAREAEAQALQLKSSFAIHQNVSFGDELPSVSCDLADLNITSHDFDQLLLQNLSDNPICLDGLSMDCDGPVNIDVSALPLTELPDMFYDDSRRPCNVDFSLPLDPNFLSFFQTLPTPIVDVIENQKGAVTPPFSGGSTPQTQSRAASPAWSESSGNMSTSSMSGPSCHRRSSLTSNPVPRHKRPSHRRAEVKRRDKIKVCLDDFKEQIPSLQGKGKFSESAVLFKAAEYMHQLKDGFSERGNKAAELRREIQCLSEEIHCFQETLPAGGLKEEAVAQPGLDELYVDWVAKQSKISTKHYVFTSITSCLFDTFRTTVGDASSFDSLASKVKDWQTKYLCLPVLRKQILNGMLKLSRSSNVVAFPKDLDLGSSVDGRS